MLLRAEVIILFLGIGQPEMCPGVKIAYGIAEKHMLEQTTAFQLYKDLIVGILRVDNPHTRHLVQITTLGIRTVSVTVATA